MNSFDDQLRERLNALGADVANLNLAGADAARQRAARRTRNQVTGVVLASVVAAVIGVLGVSQDRFFTAPEPADPTETESPTTVPSPPDEDDTNTDDPQPPPDDRTIPDDALLTIDDLAPEGEQGAGYPRWVDGVTTELPYSCAPAVPEGATYKNYDNDWDGHFLQFAEVSDDPVSRFSEIRADVESCLHELEQDAGSDEAKPFIEAWAVEGVGDEAWMASYWSRREEPINGYAYDLVLVRLVRSGDYITTVVKGAPGDEGHIGPMPTDDSETAARRLCEITGQDCVGEIEQTRLYPEPVGNLDGWLTVDDITEGTDLDNIGEGSEVRDNFGDEAEGPSGWNLVYLSRDPDADGATSFQTREYSDPVGEPGGATLTQEKAVFPDDETAREHYDALLAGMDATVDEETTLENTGTLDHDGAVATAWQAEMPGSQVTFVFGVLQKGRAVTALIYVPLPDADMTGDQMLDLLERAAAQLDAS